MFLLKYILTFVHVASRYKVGRAVRTKKVSMVAFVLEAMYKETSVCKYPKIFQCDNGHDFTVDVSKLLEKQNVDVRGATTKKHIHTAFVETFNREFTKHLFNSMIVQELQNPEKSIGKLG